ncbi:hypothetical protein BCR32DRAFT_266684 [Anaeromyces robustus]|uniref:SUEL-type lectin domain-containing protein n=1 Tax=Anaeromyces robustus TaxID=1754192 RepID=A0A1Y1XDN5_9FUNG|nr:hypothetical protein BCR32DRAFT_266684 [Anaeromyces robustus]|eukprot:ORX83891.1 hypothetical protein BCR32DRAFT_266684 [Anaeromyces robustus]
MNRLKILNETKIEIIVITIILSLIIFFTSKFTIRKTLYEKENILAYQKDIISSKNNYINETNLILENFKLVDNKNIKGPITIDKNLDNGKKVNIYEKITNLTDNKIETFLTNNELIQKLPLKILKDENYLCETYLITEDKGQGYNINCPLFYHIVIDKAFYGRYKGDDQRCRNGKDGKELDKYFLDKYRVLKMDCGKDRTFYFKNLCEGKNSCIILVKKNLEDTCIGYYKYVHLNYHCQKDYTINIPKFAIVMFENQIKVNSITENAISELYQYANIHGYKFILNTEVYDNERDLKFMKLHTLFDVIIEGLKTKQYEWIFWTDGDVVLTNPNIKLETFLPIDSNIHFIATSDQNSLNTVSFLIRVNSWSLNYITRAIAYLYYHSDMRVENVIQVAMNNILLESKEDSHYTIVPFWFNNYVNNKKLGDFLINLAGHDNKDKEGDKVRREVFNNKDWITAKTNKQLREEVVNYYNLPKEKQIEIWKL